MRGAQPRGGAVAVGGGRLRRGRAAPEGPAKSCGTAVAAAISPPGPLSLPGPPPIFRPVMPLRSLAPLRTAALAAALVAAGPAAAQTAGPDADVLAAAVTPGTARPPAPPAASETPYRPSDRFDRPLAVEAAPSYYLVRDAEPIRTAPDATGRVMDRLDFRSGVRVLAVEGPWALVAVGRAQGYVDMGALSNVWLRVDKSDRTVYVYRGAELLRALPADVSTDDRDKTFRSSRDNQEEWRTPEGTYWITRRNASSQYHLAFVINYPNQYDAEEGLRQGLISQAEYAAIVRADLAFESPPMGTALGGLIELHGSGSGRQRAWTRGCIALRNVHMDWLWEFVPVGAPVVVER